MTVNYGGDFIRISVGPLYPIGQTSNTADEILLEIHHENLCTNLKQQMVSSSASAPLWGYQSIPNNL